MFSGKPKVVHSWCCSSLCSRDNIVGLVIRQWKGQPSRRASIPNRDKSLYLLLSVYIGSGVHQPPIYWVPRALYIGSIVRKVEFINRLHISRAVVKNKWSRVHTLSLCIHGEYKDKFIKLWPYAVSWFWGRVRQPGIAWELRSGSVGFCRASSARRFAC